MTFKKIKVGQDFIYKDLIYVKLNNNVAFNSTYGTFVIHPHEKVKLLNENMINLFSCSSNFTCYN